MAQPNTIDLSAGLVPAQNEPAQSSGVDLSAGLVPANATAQAPQGYDEEADAAYKSQKWHSIGQDLMHGDLRKAAGEFGGMFTDENPGMVEAKRQVKEAGKGAAKSAAQTLATVGDVATLGLTHLLPGSENASGGIGAHGTALEPSNEDQQGGAMTEQVAEYALGEGVFKALSKLPLTERLLQTSKILETAKKYPALAKLLHAGVRGATVGGTVGGIHGGTTGAIEGATLGGAAEMVPQAPAAIREAYKGVTGKALQETLQTGIRDVLGSVAEDAGVTPAKTSVRDSAKSVADSVYADAKSQYAAIDKATGGKFSPIDDALKNVNREIQQHYGVDEAKDALLDSRKAELMQKLDSVLDEAKANGLADDAITAARNTYKRAQALYDLDAQIKASTDGISAGRSNRFQASENVSPKKLFLRLNKLWDSGRLQEAIGDDAAKDLIDHAYEAKRTAAFRARVAPAAVTGSLLYGAKHGITHAVIGTE